jgi:hypothetical protein
MLCTRCSANAESSNARRRGNAPGRGLPADSTPSFLIVELRPHRCAIAHSPPLLCTGGRSDVTACLLTEKLPPTGSGASLRGSSAGYLICAKKDSF